MSNEISRRGFLGALLPVLPVLPVLPLALGKEEREADVTNDGALTCRWIGHLDGGGSMWLCIGRDTAMDRYGKQAAGVEAVLWQPSPVSAPNLYQFRFGHEHHVFEAGSRAGAKQLAEQKLVEWLRAALVEVERFAFRLRR